MQWQRYSKWERILLSRASLSSNVSWRMICGTKQSLAFRAQ